MPATSKPGMRERGEPPRRIAGDEVERGEQAAV